MHLNRTQSHVPTRVLGIIGVIAVCSSLIGAASAAGTPVVRPTNPFDQLVTVDGSSASGLGDRKLPRSAQSAPVQPMTFESGDEYKVEVEPRTTGETDVSDGADASRSDDALSDPQSSKQSKRQVETGSLERGDWVEVGDTNVSIALSASSVESAANPDIDEVNVAFLDPQDFPNSGAAGLVIQITADLGEPIPAIAAKIPRDVLSGIYGGDFDSRVRWIQLDSQGRPISGDEGVVSTTDTDGATIVTASPSSSSVTIAAATSPTSATGRGTYSATPLNAASSWDVSAQTGAFTWKYPMSTPPAAAGPEPELGLTYNSQNVDGLTSATNNQSSPAGLGWNLSAGGFIERQYVSCSESDGVGSAHTTSGDLCWKVDNATISFGGQSGPLVKTSTSGQWRYQNDDGTRIQLLTGSTCGTNPARSNECWLITSDDGTKYYFGMHTIPNRPGVTNSVWTVPVYGDDSGEPCYNATFSSAYCTQAWRWNLDYVVDVHGNREAFFYNAETNKYRRGNTTAVSYVRGGSLSRIDYGFRADATTPSGQVDFIYDQKGRCISYAATSSNPCTNEAAAGAATAPTAAAQYPDVPFDQLCTNTTCTDKLSPTFWSTVRLKTVQAKAWKSSAYSVVDSWALDHTFPNPGDGTKAMWLSKVVRTGSAGGSPIAEPETLFSPVALQNRVNVANDGKSFLDTMRLNEVQSSLGAVISVQYSAQECTSSDRADIIANPDANTKLCFPQWWSSQLVPPVPETKDIFHKYVVKSVVADPHTSGGESPVVEKSYDYGTPAWRYNSSRFTLSKYRTWSVFAGFDTTEVREGSSTDPESQRATKYYFFQGMNGDKDTSANNVREAKVVIPGIPDLDDELWFAGRTRYVVSYDGAHEDREYVKATLSTPAAFGPTATDSSVSSGSLASRAVWNQEVKVEEPTTAGSRVVTTTETHGNSDLFWLPTTVETTHSDARSTCTTTTYADSVSGKPTGLPKQVVTIAKPCATVTSATIPDDVVSNSRFYYDGMSLGAAPDRGLTTKEEIVDSYDGTTAHWLPRNRTAYDSMGRAISETNPLGRTAATTYSPSVGGPLASTISTNTAPFNWSTTTSFDAGTGAITSIVDTNSALTTLTYDALGRRTGVWYPERPKASNPQPSVGYSYVRSSTSPNAIATSRISMLGTITDFELFDGLGRSFQTQKDAEGVGTIVTGTRFDSTGRSSIVDNPYWTTSTSPSAVRFVPVSQSAIPSWSSREYDGAGRVLSSTLHTFASEHSKTTTRYEGADKVVVDPPDGTAPTATVKNSLGQLTELLEFQGDVPLESTPALLTEYSYDARGKVVAMEDPAGNTWSWEYDPVGRQTRAVDPDTGETVSSYDDGGNLMSTTDSRGVTLSYQYDNLDRRIATYEGAGETGALLSSWTYDTLRKGQLTSSTSYVGSSQGTPASPGVPGTPGVPGLAYTQTVTGYDSADRALGSTLSIPTGAPAFAGQSFTNSNTYNAAGLIAKMNYPAAGGLPAETVSYGYNELDLQMSASSATLTVTATHNALGQLTMIDRDESHRVYTSFGYDAATNAVAGIQHTYNGGSGGIPLATSSYSRDSAGNVKKIDTTASGLSPDVQCFEHDSVGVMIEAWTPADGDCGAAPTSANLSGPAPFWQTYDVDNTTGNRTSITRFDIASDEPVTDTYSYPTSGGSKPHAVQSVVRDNGPTSGSRAYGYDSAGNTIARPGQSLAYDAFGKLSTTTQGLAKQTRVYDVNGTLILQVDPTDGATLFLPGTQIMKKPGNTVATASREYTVAGIAVAEASTSPGVAGIARVWVCANDQGTASIRVDRSSGAVTRRYSDPFGDLRGSGVSWGDSRNFLNQPKSDFTGLVQLGARAYDPEMGRFVSVDPILNPTNPKQNSGYSYGWNNPVTASDPTGLEPWPWLYEGLTYEDNGGKGGGGKTAVGGQPPEYPPCVGVGCFKTNATHYSAAKFTKLVAEKIREDEAGCESSGFLGRSECDPAMEFAAEMLESDAGPIVGGWAFGQLDPGMYYGAGTPVSDVVKDGNTASQMREAMKDQLRAGKEDAHSEKWNDYGKVTDLSNPNVLRDGLTFAFPKNASQKAWVEMALGSYGIHATTMELDTKTRTATIAYVGYNKISLGSGLAASEAIGNYVQQYAPQSGGFSDVEMHFGWTEEIRY